METKSYDAISYNPNGRFIAGHLLLALKYKERTGREITRLGILLEIWVPT